MAICGKTCVNCGHHTKQRVDPETQNQAKPGWYEIQQSSSGTVSHGKAGGYFLSEQGMEAWQALSKEKMAEAVRAQSKSINPEENKVLIALEAVNRRDKQAEARVQTTFPSVTPRNLATALRPSPPFASSTGAERPPKSPNTLLREDSSEYETDTEKEDSGTSKSSRSKSDKRRRYKKRKQERKLAAKLQQKKDKERRKRRERRRKNVRERIIFRFFFFKLHNLL